MPTYAAAKERSLDDIRESLGNLVRDFEADARGNRELIRNLLDNDRGAFYASSIEILKISTETRGAQYLVALLVANGMLLEALGDPALSREQAFGLGRAAVRIDPACDASLARGLADSESGQGTVFVRDAPRLMEVLCEIGDPGRMMASMLRLLRHPNPFLRSKAVKVVGRGSKSAKWVRQRLTDPDPRIRANAVESIWGVDTIEARTLLQFAAADGSNRVKANALLGLYYLGECAALTELVRMAGDESGVARSSAAWAMGETGDTRFVGTLRRLLNDTDPNARKRAFAALGSFKRSTPRNAEAAVWHVAARILGTDQKGWRRVLVSIAGDGARPVPAIPPLGFLLSEGGSYVISYKVSTRPEPEAISVVFLMPRAAEAAAPFRQGIASCLEWKRNSDLWCILPYIESGDGEIPETGEDPEGISFTASSDALRKMLEEPARRLECSGLWSSVWRAVKLEGAAARGTRHVFILSTNAESLLAGHGVVAKARAPRLRIQAISSSPSPHLRDLCDSIQASYQLVDPSSVADTVRNNYLALLGRYEITYQSVIPDAPALKVRVQAPGGAGEVTVPYPAQDTAGPAGPR